MGAQSGAAKEGGKYFKGVRAELKKVSWPNRKELTSYTGVVLSVCIASTLAIWVVDSIFRTGLKFFM
jgi:preprotein translocase subunit SecE